MSLTREQVKRICVEMALEAEKRSRFQGIVIREAFVETVDPRLWPLVEALQKIAEPYTYRRLTHMPDCECEQCVARAALETLNVKLS